MHCETVLSPSIPASVAAVHDSACWAVILHEQEDLMLLHNLALPLCCECENSVSSLVYMQTLHLCHRRHQDCSNGKHSIADMCKESLEEHVDILPSRSSVCMP